MDVFRDADTNNNGYVGKRELLNSIKKHMQLEEGSDKPTAEELAKALMDEID